MAQNHVIHAQITVALHCVRVARVDGDQDLIKAAERHLDKLLDRLETGVSV